MFVVRSFSHRRFLLSHTLLCDQLTKRICTACLLFYLFQYNVPLARNAYVRSSSEAPASGVGTLLSVSTHSTTKEPFFAFVYVTPRCPLSLQRQYAQIEYASVFAFTKEMRYSLLATTKNKVWHALLGRTRPSVSFALGRVQCRGFGRNAMGCSAARFSNWPCGSIQLGHDYSSMDWSNSGGRPCEACHTNR